MSFTSSTIESEATIQQYLTNDTAHELLARASTNILGNNIYTYLIRNSIIQPHDGYIIFSKVNKSPHYSNPSDIYILIKILKKQQGGRPAKIGHVTLHLIRTDLNNYVHRGASHIVNNRSTVKCARIIIRRRVQTDIRGGLTFSLGSNVCGHPINNPLPQIMTGVLYILNEYFTPSSELSLRQLICNNATNIITNYANEVAPSRRSHGGTRRVRKMNQKSTRSQGYYK
jgi:hypothetical protein